MGRFSVFHSVPCAPPARRRTSGVCNTAQASGVGMQDGSSLHRLADGEKLLKTSEMTVALSSLIGMPAGRAGARCSIERLGLFNLELSSACLLWIVAESGCSLFVHACVPISRNSDGDGKLWKRYVSAVDTCVCQVGVCNGLASSVISWLMLWCYSVNPSRSSEKSDQLLQCATVLTTSVTATLFLLATTFLLRLLNTISASRYRSNDCYVIS